MVEDSLTYVILKINYFIIESELISLILKIIKLSVKWVIIILKINLKILLI